MAEPSYRARVLHARIGLAEASPSAASLRILPSRVPEDLGIPRVLPIDVAMKRLGHVTVIPDPDDAGGFVRNKALGEAFWSARRASDLAIIRQASALTVKDVPTGFFPDGFGFELLPDEIRLAVFRMEERRRLAGVPRFECGGLMLGYWDDVYSPNLVEPMPSAVVSGVLFLLHARDVALVLAGALPNDGCSLRHAQVDRDLGPEMSVAFAVPFLAKLAEAGLLTGKVDLKSDVIYERSLIEHPEIAIPDWYADFGTISY